MSLPFIWFLQTFGTKINNEISNGWHSWTKIGAGRELEKLCKINNVVAMLNDVKDFCCSDLKCCYVLLSNFLLDLYSFFLKPKENMHEVRFPNIYILSHIIYYIVPVTIIFCFGNKISTFFKGQTNSQCHISLNQQVKHRIMGYQISII